MTYQPKPGDIFLTRIGGWFGWLVALGQGLFAGDWSRFTHAGIVLDGGEVIAAQPWGARIDPLDDILHEPDTNPRRPREHLAWLPVPEWAEDRRDVIVNVARAMEGTGYGYLSYPWIVTRPFGGSRGLDRLVSRSTRLICSALADEVWRRCGIHLFDDGRLVHEVTPGDLHHVGTVHHANTGPYKETTR